MKASLHSARIAPKKANLIAELIRGKAVHEAVEILRTTNKKAARLLEKLVRSAAANATHNDRQSASLLVVRTVTVNKAQAYHRGIPMARGRMRRIRKFLSHIHLQLGIGSGDADSAPAASETGSGRQKTTKGTEQTAVAKTKAARTNKAPEPSAAPRKATLRSRRTSTSSSSS